MKHKLLAIVYFLIFTTTAYCIGFDVKTGSPIIAPGFEMLGNYKGSWYTIEFDKPGNLNKPPKYKISKYAPGFGTGKTSILYNSFGEKTHYLQAAFINNKISLFYAVCEKREDEESLRDNRDGRKIMPIIMQQDFDVNTLEPIGNATVLLDQKDEYFAASAIEIVHSLDYSKSAIVIKPYYKHQKYKVIIWDNTRGAVTQKTFDFKLMKTYLMFIQSAISNSGQIYLVTKVRDDILTYQIISKDKSETTYHVFSIDKNSKEPATVELKSPNTGKYFQTPIVSALASNEFVVAFDYYTDIKSQTFKGTSLFKYDASLNATGKRDVTPSENFIEKTNTYHIFKKGNEFSNLKLQKIVALDDANFMLLAEYVDTVAHTLKNLITSTERNYLICYRMDETMNVKAQHLLDKKQKSAIVNYAFSAQVSRKGNEFYVFYNGDWETDDENAMNLQCARFATDGSAPEIRKVVNTSNNFFIKMENSYTSGTNKIVFEEHKLVEYQDITREIKLVEITLK